MSAAAIATFAEPGDSSEDQTLCNEIGQLICKHYPEWTWKIEVPPMQGVIIVRNLDCDPRGKWGFVIHRSKLDIGRKIVVASAGELLERWNMSRTRSAAEEINGREMLFVKPEN